MKTRALKAELLDLPSWPKPTRSSEAQRLRARVNRLVAQLGDEFEKPMLARALVAKACNVSLEAVGTLATANMTRHATNLLAGHWSEETESMFIES